MPISGVGPYTVTLKMIDIFGNGTMKLVPVTAFADRFAMLEDGPAVWNRLAELSRRYAFAGRQVHDANIVATMLAHGEHQCEGLRAALTLRSTG